MSRVALLAEKHPEWSRAVYGTRNTATNQNLNRDFMKLDQPEMQALSDDQLASLTRVQGDVTDLKAVSGAIASHVIAPPGEPVVRDGGAERREPAAAGLVEAGAREPLGVGALARPGAAGDEDRVCHRFLPLRGPAVPTDDLGEPAPGSP